jgi:hypothetical protein
MMVLCSNHSSSAFHALAHRHPGKVGWIFGPSNWKNPKPNLPYALDNDAFGAWKNGAPWNESAWLKMLEKSRSCEHAPMWAVVPDVVADRKRTLENWKTYADIVHANCIHAAFAVQDAMTPSDVPKDAALVFVGGTTSWKWRSLPMWCEHFPRVHVGRVRIGKLPIAERNGAESVDGTGFFRETAFGKPARQLEAFLEGHRDTTIDMFPEMYDKPRKS